MAQLEALGHRERKKQRTRQRIIVAGIELFAERGFKGTTVADIAAAADISPSTFFLYFNTKDELLFEEQRVAAKRLEDLLGARRPGELTLDVLRCYHDPVPPSPEVLRLRRLRYRVVASEQALQGPDHASYADAIRPSLLGAYEQDLGIADEDDPRARLMTGLTIGAIMESVYVIRELVVEGTFESRPRRLAGLREVLHDGLEAAYRALASPPLASDLKRAADT
jgi:AcrR family transcriptional regulator